MITPKTLEQYSQSLAKEKVKFYSPFERLLLRKIVEDSLQVGSTARIDLFAIFDAVSKRGGYARVEQSKRWTQIEYSLPYYKVNFKQIYTQHISKKQNEIKKALKCHDKQYITMEQPFVQLHFVSTSSAGGYYHFEQDENSFCKQNYIHVDLYFNIKSICAVPCPLEKILVEFADKYLLTRKWLIMKGYSKPFSNQQLDRLQIVKTSNNEASVIFQARNFRLHWSGGIQQTCYQQFSVTLYTNLQKQHQAKHLQRLLCIQQGVFYLDDGVGGPFSYRQILSDNDVQLCEVSNYCGLIDQNGRTIPEFRVRESEEMFLGLLTDFKFQEGNKKTLADQVVNLMAKKKVNDELNLMKWHMDRYLMLNNLNGDQTTVNIHSTYLNRRKHKIYMTRKKPLYIKSCLKLVEKALKVLTVVQNRPKSIDFCNNTWIAEEKGNERRNFSCLVYSDQEQVYQMISKKNFRLSSMQHENFTILKELSSNTWVNCWFRFKEKLRLKPDVLSQLVRRKKDFHKICYYDLSEQNCSFQFSGKLGFYYYFVIDNGYTLLARCKVQKFLSASSTPLQLKQSISSEIIKQFELKLLSTKLPQLSEPQMIEYSHFFFLKDQSLNRDRIIKLKNWQRMFLSIGLPWALNANKLSSQIDCSNQILAIIANLYYKLYKYDQKTKQYFSQEYRKKKVQAEKKEAKGDRQGVDREKGENKMKDEGSIEANQVSQKQREKSFQKISKAKGQTLLSQSPNKSNSFISRQHLALENLTSQKHTSQPQIIQNLQQPQPEQLQIYIEVVLKMLPNFNQSELSQSMPKDTLKSQQDSIIPQNSNQKYKNSKITKDLFCFSHPFIQSTFKYVNDFVAKSRKEIFDVLNKNSKKNHQSAMIIQQKCQPKQQTAFQSLKVLQSRLKQSLKQLQTTLQLHHPYKLDNNSFLHSFGQISLQFPCSKCILKKLQQLEHEIAISSESGEILSERSIPYQLTLMFLKNFMVKKQYYSLDNPFTTTIYVLCVIFIEKPQRNEHVPLFVMFEETNLAIFYYHSSLQRLTVAFNRHLQKLRQSHRNKKQHFYRTKRSSKLYQDSKRVQLMFEEIQNKIQEELKFQDKNEFLSQLVVFDKILLEKLKSEVPQQVYQSPSQTNLYSKIPYPQNNEQKCHFLMGLLNNFTHQELKKHGLKENITLLDIFFGYFTPKYFVFQMYWTKQLQMWSKGGQSQEILFEDVIDQLKEKDAALHSEIVEIMDKNNENFSYEDYPADLQFDETGLMVQRKFLAGKNDPLNIKTQSIEDALVTEKQPQSTNKPLESYYVQKSQLLKNYIFIKQYNFKDSYESRNDKEKVRCFLMIGQSQKRIELDPKQDPLELIVSILVDTWDYEEIYHHFVDLVRREISNCQYNLSERMKLYYYSTRKKPILFGVDEVNMLRSTLSYKKKVPQGIDKKKNYKTEYCKDDDDRQTILEHIQNETMVFADGQIIICKY